MLKFRDVEREMLPADVVECPDDPALHEGEETLRAVAVNNHSVRVFPGIFLRGVFDWPMPVFRFQPDVALIFVGVNL
jgi:hypothetical protein